MRKFFFIFFLYSLAINAQDKLFFKNGTLKKGIVVSVARDFVYFKTTDTSFVEKISKSKLVLIEDYRGTRYLFSDDESRRDSVKLFPNPADFPRNVLSVQPFAFLFGRANFSYERLTKDYKIGVVIPLIITFDPAFGNIFNPGDSTRNLTRVKGINYITGIDLNFYLGKKERSKVFIGPRIRYGTDVALLNTEAYSIQTQFGLRVGSPQKKVVQHLSVGFGFVRILSSANLRLVDSRQFFGWYSLNYRLGVKW